MKYHRQQPPIQDEPNTHFESHMTGRSESRDQTDMRCKEWPVNLHREKTQWAAVECYLLLSQIFHKHNLLLLVSHSQSNLREKYRELSVRSTHNGPNLIHCRPLLTLCVPSLPGSLVVVNRYMQRFHRSTVCECHTSPQKERKGQSSV